MSDWHFGIDYDMWLYPPVDWMASDYDYELPEPIEAADIEGTLLINAEDAIEQVRRLQAENAKLRELMSVMAYCNQFRRDCDGCSMNGAAGIITERAGCDELLARLRELGVGVTE